MNSVEIVHLQKLLRTLKARVESTQGGNSGLVTRLNAVGDALQHILDVNLYETKVEAHLAQVDELILELETKSKCVGSGT
jgi:molybdenum-dependent DNA-binding transcriptional regulator ModE